MQCRNATNTTLPVARKSKSISYTLSLSTMDHEPWTAKAENQNLCALLSSLSTMDHGKPWHTNVFLLCVSRL